MAKDLEAPLRPAIPDIMLLLRVEVVGSGDSRGCRGRSRDRSRMTDIVVLLAVVLIAGCPASSGLQDALEEDCLRVGGVVILRVRHNHEVGP